MNPKETVNIRECALDDMPSVQAIYAREVETGLASFEYEPPAVEEMTRRFQEFRASGMPYYVAEIGGQVVGYAYGSAFRPRFGYRFTAEDSVYLAPDARGKGVGKLLLQQVIQDCERGGWRQMIAAIGDSGNTPSIALHASLGFRQVGIQKSVGFKLGQWVDVVIMQLELGEGDHTLPDG